MPVGPYEDEALRTLVSECAATYAELQDVLESGDLQSLAEGLKVGPPLSLSLPRDGGAHPRNKFVCLQAAMVIQHQTILRRKRCALAYLQHRLERLTALRWEAGLVLPDEVRANMSRQEVAFYTEYDDLFADFSRGIRLDLAAGKRPPKELLIEVRALADCGELLTEHSGLVNLDKGTSHFLRATDVEHLINQGLLEHIV